VAEGLYGLLVIGAGGHAAEVCSYANAVAASTGVCRLLGCIDDVRPPGRDGPVVVLGGFEVIGQLLGRGSAPLHCITAVGDNATRQRLVERVNAVSGGRVVWTTLRHPAAVVGEHVEIGPGTCLAPGSIVTSRARIGAHVILNVKASVAHDSTVGDYANLNPGATIAGNSRVGNGTYIGAAATVIDRVTVGDWAIVGAGAVVTRHLTSHVTAVGVPARIIKHHVVAS
jgi:sugar O-acyltransferase (sialic acid O-acetyltransferase NeuD family)